SSGEVGVLRLRPAARNSAQDDAIKDDAKRAAATKDYAKTSAPPRLRGEATFTRTLRLPVPLRDAKIFLKLLQLEFDAHPPGAAVVRVTVAAEPARPQAVQAGLFATRTPDPARLQVLLARLAAI